MLASQFLASALHPSHPLFDVVSSPQGPRNMKATLKVTFVDLVDGVLPDGSAGIARSRIHTLAVSNYIALGTPYPLLGTPPPPVHASKKFLLRQCRTILAQIWSSHCSQLKDY